MLHYVTGVKADVAIRDVLKFDSFFFIIVNYVMIFTILTTYGSFHVNSTSVFHGPPQIVLKFGTVVEHG